MVFTQPYTILLQPYCGTGIWLRWLSALGAWDGFLFDGDTDTRILPEAGSVFRPEVGAARKLSGSATPRQLLRVGNLTPAQWDALATVFDSPQVYVQDAGGTLTPVLVVPANVDRTSSDTRPTFDVEVEYTTSNPITR